MSKNALDGKRTNLFLVPPEDLVIVDDVASALHDDRAGKPVSESLVLNIMAHGVLEPILVRKNGDTGKIEVIAGRQRVKACLEANKRLKKQGAELLEVPCVVKRGDAHQLMAFMVSENEGREDDSPIGRAKKLARYLDLGRTIEQAAVVFCVSPATAKNLLGLLDAPKEVQKALGKGEITASDAYKLSKLEPSEAKYRLKQLDKQAPKPEGRRRGKVAKKAREIISGGAVEVRSKAEIEKMRDAVADNIYCPGEIKRHIECVFAWLLGDSDVMLEFTEKPDAEEKSA